MSPTRGSMSCGVTVVTEVRKEMVRKAGKDLVMQRPILSKLSVWTDTMQGVGVYGEPTIVLL